MTSTVSRWSFAGLGVVLTILEPALPYIVICTLAILYDCYTAWSLGRRIRVKYPDKVNASVGKFKSQHFGRVITTLLKCYALIVLAFLIERYIVCGALPMDVTKMAAGAICFWQLLSILENESSCNGSAWAKLAQKVLIDKTSRHIGFDLSELNKGDKNEDTY